MFRGKIQRIHFVGIGGSGMSGIAEVLVTQGYAVTGSDLNESSAIERLRTLGATIHIGHDPGYINDVDVVVKSTAIPDRNVEIRAAHALKIPVIPRAEMLGELMRMKYGLAVAGSHGKTTTTSMLARCLHHAGLDPTIVIGGRLDSIGSSARLGAGEFLVAEADESDGSFLTLDPTVAVVTSIDPEHMEHWGSFERLLDGFVQFTNKVPFFGFATLCLDHPNVQALLPRIRRRVITYGLTTQADCRAEDITPSGEQSAFTVVWHDQPLGRVTLGMPGRHNVENALAAITVGLELGVAFTDLQAALDGFKGVDRRFSIRHRIGSGTDEVTIIDDYGHHPAEISATLAGAAEAWPHRRLIAVFQPHRYTRVRDLLDDFARSFNQANHVVACPIYRAGEKPIEGLDALRVAAALRNHGHRSVQPVTSLAEAGEHLASVVQPGDVVITLGAGDVNTVCGRLAEHLTDSPA
ncbi:MAG: UDP-N-acetylmuramate--L-alanine ligase [Deltaproteobacteria bacterium]|nr:UDP-N-acetylmuramate--L-alanine ligase [Deltaproteobacteria bacterium]HCH62492.1 UDP-N-acetylmuramate--L-alanine ligase [Deltaproteobacteria bacterium]